MFLLLEATRQQFFYQKRWSRFRENRDLVVRLKVRQTFGTYERQTDISKTNVLDSGDLKTDRVTAKKFDVNFLTYHITFFIQRSLFV